MSTPCRHLLALGLALAMNATAHAAGAIQNVDIQCSSALTIDNQAGLSLSCVGDLRLNGLASDAALLDDAAIRLVATGALALDGLLLRAPSLSLSADTISLSPTVRLDSGGGPIDLNTWSPDVPLSISGAGGVVLAGQVSTVPEPATGALGLLALGLGLALAGSRRAR